jgi:predicted  nucleic acid-binding Zn-ribbon protein
MSDEKGRAGFTLGNIQATAAMVKKLGLCTRCGDVLPLGHPKSVLTCPKCGARSLPREAAQESASDEDVARAAYLAGWRAGASIGPYIGQPTTSAARAYDDGFEHGRHAYRAAHTTGADPLAAAHAAGVAEERARCLWLLQRDRLEAIADEDGVGGARLRGVEIHVEAGTRRPT